MVVNFNQDHYLKKCALCGACCSATQSGDVFLYPNDFFRLNIFLGYSENKFINRYLKIVEYEYHVRDNNLEPTGTTIFLPIFALQMTNQKGCPFYNPKIKLCEVYTARPAQCRFFPLIYCILEDHKQLNQMNSKCNVIHELLSDISKTSDISEKPSNILEISKEIVENLTLDERRMEYEFYKVTWSNLPSNWDSLSNNQQKRVLVQIYKIMKNF
ncbi:MAG: hypothetical protein DRO88_08600 [Promethearchaeia archaeon]|nr:MAG: hypothetical protein DRO88_08600 [Candidatus Lokiarchaeia archaeon]